MDTWFCALAVFLGFLVWIEALYDLIGGPSGPNFWLLGGGERRCDDDSRDQTALTDNDDVDFWGGLEFSDGVSIDSAVWRGVHEFVGNGAVSKRAGESYVARYILVRILGFLDEEFTPYAGHTDAG